MNEQKPEQEKYAEAMKTAREQSESLERLWGGLDPFCVSEKENMTTAESINNEKYAEAMKVGRDLGQFSAQVGPVGEQSCGLLLLNPISYCIAMGHYSDAKAAAKVGDVEKAKQALASARRVGIIGAIIGLFVWMIIITCVFVRFLSSFGGL